MSILIPDYFFFVIDNFYEESAPDDETYIYSYPKIDVRQASLFIGQIKFMIDHISTFIEKGIKVLTTSKKKIIVNINNNIVIALCGKILDEKDILENKLNEIINTYYFYYEDIYETKIKFAHERKSFLNLIDKRFTYLLRMFEELLLFNININTHLSLLPGCRHFIQASRILFNLHRRHFIKGCIFYKEEILCTYLEYEQAKKILMKYLSIKNENKFMELSNLYSHISIKDNTIIYIPVFINKDKYSLCLLFNMTICISFVTDYEKFGKPDFINYLELETKIDELEKNIIQTLYKK